MDSSDFVQFSPDRRQSNRSFAMTLAGVSTALSIFMKLQGYTRLFWISLIGTVLFLALGIFFSKKISLLNELWYLLGLRLAKIFSILVLSFFFYFFLTPLGLLMRLLNQLEYSRNRRIAKTTYWKKRSHDSQEKKQIEYQF